MTDKLPHELERALQKCDNSCNHFYVKHVHKNDTVHYPIFCTNHGFMATLPRSTALSDIADGALVVPYEDRVMSTEDYKVALTGNAQEKPPKKPPKKKSKYW